MKEHHEMPKTTSNKLLEPQIKLALIRKLLAKANLDAGEVVINEFMLDRWNRRADLVVVDKEMIAYEIKSDKDSLVRLRGQISTYLRFFDKLVLVVSKRHRQAAMELAPPNVAVWEIDHNERFRILRKGQKRRIHNREALIRLLRVTELRHLLREQGISPLPKFRSELEDVAMLVPLAKLREAVTSALKRRFGKSTEKFLCALRRGELTSTAYLRLLSPYVPINRTAGSNINSGCTPQKFEIRNTQKQKVADLNLLNLARITREKLFGPVPKEIPKRLKQR